MWTSQVYGHHDKKDRTKTHRTSQNTEYTKTQQTLENNYFFVFCGFLCCFFFNFHLFKRLLQKMLNNRLGPVNEKHWGFTPVFRCSKPHTFSTFSGEEKEKNVHSLFLTRPLR